MGDSSKEYDSELLNERYEKEIFNSQSQKRLLRTQNWGIISLKISNRSFDFSTHAITGY